MNEQSIRTLLLEEKAVLLRRGDTPRTAGAIIVRFWPEVLREDYDACSAFLKTYTSVLNAAAAITVVAPKVDGKEQPGTWYCSKVDWQYGDSDPSIQSRGAKLNLYQTLVRADAIEAETLIEDSCRQSVYAQIKYDQATLPALPSASAGTMYRQRWDYSSDRGTYTVVAERIVRKQQGPVTFTRLAAMKKTVTETVTLGKSGSSPSAAAAPSIGVTQEADIKLNEDCSHDDARRTETVLETLRESRKTTTKASSISTGAKNATAAPAPTVPAVGETIGYDKQENVDGSWDYDERIDIAPPLTGTRKIYPGTKPATAVTKGRNAVTEPSDPGAPTAGVRRTWEKDENPDGTWDSSTTDETAPPLTGTRKIYPGTKPATAVTKGRNAVTEPSDPGASTAGVRRTWEKDENPDGTWDYSTTDEAAPPLSGARKVYRGTKGSSTGSRLRNQATEPSDPGAPAAGVRRIWDKDENPDGTWDSTTTDEDLSTDTRTSEVFEATALETIAVAAVQNAANKLTAPTAADGYVRRRRNTETEEGLWNTEDEERTAVPYDTGWVTHSDVNGNTSVRAWRNQPVAFFTTVKAAFVEGEQNTISPPIKNAFGLYDGFASRTKINSIGSSGSDDPNPTNYSYSVTVNGITYSVGVRITSFLTYASNFLNGVSNVMAAGLPVPGIKPVGRNMWMATKVTA